MGPTPEAFRLGGLSGLIATFQLNVCKAFLKADPSLTVTESPKSGLFVCFFHFPSSCSGMQCVYGNSSPGGGAKVFIFYYLVFFLLGDKLVLSYYSQSGFGS